MNCRNTRFTDVTQEVCSSKCNASDPECFSVFTPKQSGSSKFYFIKPSQGGVSWEEAENACKNMNMQLASIRTESEQIEARNPLMPTAWHKMRKAATKTMGPLGGIVGAIGSKLEKSDPLLMHWAWIGLTSEDGNDWKWKDPNAPSPQDVFPSKGSKFGWGKEYGIKQSGTKKSTGPGDKRCAALVRGMWNDTPCNNKNNTVSGYMCEHVSTCDVYKCDDEMKNNNISVEGAMFNSYKEFERRGEVFDLTEDQMQQIQNADFNVMDKSKQVDDKKNSNNKNAKTANKDIPNSDSDIMNFFQQIENDMTPNANTANTAKSDVSNSELMNLFQQMKNSTPTQNADTAKNDNDLAMKFIDAAQKIVSKSNPQDEITQQKSQTEPSDIEKTLQTVNTLVKLLPLSL